MRFGNYPWQYSITSTNLNLAAVFPSMTRSELETRSRIDGEYRSAWNDVAARSHPPYENQEALTVTSSTLAVPSAHVRIRNN
jgi:hypothetical protein